MLFELRLKLPGDIHKVFGVHKGASVELTLAIDVRTLDELLIKHHDNLLLCLSNNCSTGSKRHISTLN